MKYRALSVSIFLLSIGLLLAAWTHGRPASGAGSSVTLTNLLGPSYGTSAGSRTVSQPAASTADYYLIDGLYWTQIIDLQNCCGSWGTNIQSTKGFRYAWLIGPDHPVDPGSGWPCYCGWFSDGGNTWVGYSNDPGIMPDPSTLVALWAPAQTIDGGASVLGNFQHFVYNPDDATHSAYVYVQMGATSGPHASEHNTVLFIGADFEHLTYFGIAFNATMVNYEEIQNNVFRTGTNTWVAYGYSTEVANGNSGNGYVKWTSTDGKTWTNNNTALTDSGSGLGYDVTGSGGNHLSVSGVTYFIGGQSDTTVTCTGNNPGQAWAAQFPVDSSGNFITSPAVTRLTSAYQGCFPGPTYVQSVATYTENGVGYTFVEKGFFQSLSAFCSTNATYGTICLNNGPYAGGGGLSEEYLDLIIRVFDSTLAVNAAPPAVTISAAGGTVTLSWQDILPNHTYFVNRCTAGGASCSSSTRISAPTTGSTTDSPTASSSCTLTYYKVGTLNGSTEEDFRIVGTYVSSQTALVNKHITRACLDGVNYSTIDITRTANRDNWLQSTCNCLGYLEFWTSTVFGVKESSGVIISKIYDYGTTFLPRGGDYTTTTSSTNYGSTACGGNGIPGWTNTTATAYGYYGGQRINNLRRKSQITFLAAYSTTTTSAFLATNYNSGANLIDTVTGSTHVAQFQLSDNTGSFSTASQTISDGHTTHIIAGTYDGTHVKSWVEGVSGSSVSGPADNSQLTGLMGQGNSPMLSSGSQYAYYPGSRTWLFNEAAYTGCEQIIFNVDISTLTCGATNCMASLATFLRNDIGN